MVLDDQGNKSLAKSMFFDTFNVPNITSPYKLKVYTGVSQTFEQRERGFIVESAHEGTHLCLPMIIQCDEVLDNKEEIPTPEAVKHHSTQRLKSFSYKGWTSYRHITCLTSITGPQTLPLHRG